MSTFTYPTEMTQDLVAYLRDILRNDPKEQAFKESNTLKMLEKRSVTLSGNYVEVPVSYVGTASGGPYNDNTNLPIQDVEAVKVATYEMSSYAEAARMSHRAELKTRGTKALFNAWAMRVKQARQRLRQKVATDLFSSTQVTDGITPFPIIMPSTTTSGTYGNLNRATYSWWRPYNSDTITWSSAGPAEMDDLDTGLSVDGSPGADWYVTSSSIFNKMRALARSSSYNAMNWDPSYHGPYKDMLNDQGIKAISFCGKPVIWDYYCTSDALYAVQNDSLYLGIYEDWNVGDVFSLEPVGLQAKGVFVKWAGQTICESQRRCGSLTTIT